MGITFSKPISTPDVFSLLLSLPVELQVKTLKLAASSDKRERIYHYAIAGADDWNDETTSHDDGAVLNLSRTSKHINHLLHRHAITPPEIATIARIVAPGHILDEDAAYFDSFNSCLERKDSARDRQSDCPNANHDDCSKDCIATSPNKAFSLYRIDTGINLRVETNAETKILTETLHTILVCLVESERVTESHDTSAITIVFIGRHGMRELDDSEMDGWLNHIVRNHSRYWLRRPLEFVTVDMGAERNLRAVQYLREAEFERRLRQNIL
ncbi:hypothetical protein CAC42_7438 [Sphaceloma murrayae]|uniref:Uncharacterized protein n=1 Tax=Sphaceloma murrayae TaxID=2082308 RepID=A0A2K1QX15_9PEZI|nr:hypothetical protein CAC42_7438 [Sphaceloma murrayae]